MVASDWARFAMPATWRTPSPFSVVAEDVTVSAVVNGGAAASALLRYGRQNFSSACSDPWITTSNWGRVCLQGTAAAYFASFAVDQADQCSLSTQAYSARPCSDALRFSIAVR